MPQLAHAGAFATHGTVAITIRASVHLLSNKSSANAMLAMPCVARTISLSRKHNLLELCENLSYS